MSVKADFFIVGKSDVAFEGLSRPRGGVPILGNGTKMVLSMNHLTNGTGTGTENP